MLILDGLCAVFRTNLNAGTLLTLIAGAALAAYGIWHEKLHRITERGFLKAVRYVVLAGVCFVIGMVLFLAVNGTGSAVSYDEEAVIVLGAAVHGDQVSRSLAHRLDTAAAYAEENPETLIVVSGGQGPQESVTEASAMKNYLVAKGLDPDNIVMEEKATSTYENFRFSKEILDSCLEDSYTCAYVTNDYHTYRAGRIAADAGLDAQGLGAPTDWWYTPPSYLREILAVIKYWITGT